MKNQLFRELTKDKGDNINSGLRLTYGRSLGESRPGYLFGELINSLDINNNIMNIESDVLSLLGVNETSNLNTEVVILKSPSVLLENFNYLKNSKLENGEDVSEWLYKDWVNNNLKVKLLTGTSVLNVSYKDNDKEIIIPLLNKISDSYQLYSSKDRKSNINKGINFLEEQVRIYKEKSNNSR